MSEHENEPKPPNVKPDPLWAELPQILGAFEELRKATAAPPPGEAGEPVRVDVGGDPAPSAEPVS